MKGRCKGVSLCRKSYHHFRFVQSLPEFAGKEIRLCACQKGSYTLEAAVILPLVAGFFVAVLFFFRVLQVQTSVQSALYYASRKTACEASTVSSPEVLLLTAGAYFKSEVRQYPCVERYVQRGDLNISVLQSGASENYIELRTNYKIRLPIHFFSVDGVAVTQCSKSRKWTGDKERGDEEDYVYVTEHGTVYHCSRSCSYLDLSIQAIAAEEVGAKRNKNGNKYYACSECAAGNTNIVYITDYGTCYHRNLACSSLKRTVYMVPISEVGGKGPCSKCGSP